MLLPVLVLHLRTVNIFPASTLILKDSQVCVCNVVPYHCACNFSAHRFTHACCAPQTKADASKQSPHSAAAPSLKDSTSIATPAAAHKHAPSEAYELEDLDEDWVAMLNVLDSRLLEVSLDLLFDGTSCGLHVCTHAVTVW